MFGYAVAEQTQLNESEYKRYKAIYCGICRQLKQLGGLPAQLTLTYDMALLALVISSLYEPNEVQVKKRCYSHIIKGTDCVTSEAATYCAKMNILLGYHNLKDDVTDEGKLYKKAELKLLNKCYSKVKNEYADKDAAIVNKLNELNEKEKANADADTCANIFADIMKIVFDYKQDMWSGMVADFAASLGRVIYIMDAVTDVEEDIKKDCFNPLKMMYNYSKDFKADSEDILNSLLGECVAAFEKLPLENDIGIMRNILCSGIWTKLDAKYAKNSKDKR